jgi:tetratricopeptide (TPR) repeat protein
MVNLQVERLKRLPQRADDTWQGGLVRMPAWVTGEGPKPFRPVSAVWLSLQTGLLHMSPETRRPEDADFAMALDAVAGFAANEALAGYRPGKLEVKNPALAEHLSGLLAEVGIRVECCGRLLALERVLQDLAEHVHEGPMPPGPLEGKGVTVERMRSFAEAAKVFFEAAPWQHLSNEDLLEIESPPPPAGMQYAVVLGAGGQEFGLGLYRSVDQHFAMALAEGPDDLPPEGVWSFTFGEMIDRPLADADLWDDHGLPVAGDGAYPMVMRYDDRGRLRRASAEALAFLEGLARALAATTEDEMDSGRWTKTVQTFEGPVEYRLALPFLLHPLSRKELHERGIMPDRRVLEQTHALMDRFLADKEPEDIDELNALIEKEFLGKVPDASKYPPRTLLEEAQDICYEAFDAIGRLRVKRAREALAVSPDCADAYVLLAESTPAPRKAMDLFAKGVEAGRRALGEEAFREGVGHFWGFISTRPFMRALMGLAMAQEGLEDLEGAAQNYRELLRLNPNDNQGVRDLLLPLLILLNKDAEARTLLNRYRGDIGAIRAYSMALLAFRKGGDSPSARQALARARKVNPHVPKRLLAEERVDRRSEAYSLGSEEEAAYCSDTCRRAWQSTPGALEWLANRTRTSKTKRKRQPKNKP